jgi:hypothetical protein
MDIEGVSQFSSWEGFCQEDFDGGLLSPCPLGWNIAPTCTEKVQNPNLVSTLSRPLSSYYLMDGEWSNSCATTSESESDILAELVSVFDEGSNNQVNDTLPVFHST